MKNKEKIAISISGDLLRQIDSKIDKKNFKNRSHVIESLILEGLKLKQDYGAVILAHENNWNQGDYPLDIPKVLIEIDGKTLLEKHIDNLERANVKKCVISISQETLKVKEFIEKRKFSIDIEFLESNCDTESQCIIVEASKILDVNKLLVILGDNYFHNLNLLDCMHYHNVNDNEITLVVKMMDNSSEYGNIKLEGNNVVKFVERPESRDDISFIVNAGVYIIEKDILPVESKNEKIEKSLFPSLIGVNNIRAYFHNGKWFHVQSNKILDLFK